MFYVIFIKYFCIIQGLFTIVEFEHEDSVAAILGVKEPVVFKEKVLRIKKRTFPSHKPNPEKREETANINVKKRKKKHSETLSCMLSNEVINKMNQSSTVSTLQLYCLTLFTHGLLQ